MSVKIKLRAEGTAQNNTLWQDEILNIKEAAALPSLRESGRLPALISGLSPIHRVNLAAALRRESGLPLVVICPDDTAAENFADDLRIMLDEKVTVLGMRDFVFLSAAAVSRNAEQNRIAALYEIMTGKSENIVISIPGLIQRTISREAMERAAFTIEAGMTLPPEDVEYALAACGYTRTAQVEGPGQFSRRGMILDFYSPSDRQPVRIEYWGDDVDSLSYFDINDQRRTDSVTLCRVLPCSESLCSLAAGGSATVADNLEKLAERYLKKRSSSQAAKVSETLRCDAENLRANGNLTDADKYMELIYDFSTALDYIPPNAIIFLDKVKALKERTKNFTDQINTDIEEAVRKGSMLPISRSRTEADSSNGYCLSWTGISKRLSEYPVYMGDAFTPGQPPILPQYLTSVLAKQISPFAGNLQTAADDAKSYLKQGYRVIILAGDERRAGIIREFLRQDGEMSGTDSAACTIAIGSVSAGMEYPGLKLAILTDSKMVRKDSKAKRAKKKLPKDRIQINSYADLSVGDYVVHENHGIGKFNGIIRMQLDGIEKDYIKIAYAGSDTLYVPVTALDMVTKYIGGGGEEKTVRLSKMGGAEWNRTRMKAKGAAKEMAEKLIKLYAERQRIPGRAFSADSEWQREFEDNFGYTETDDQLKCVAEIKADMESSVPMDRLLCGDVGFGKTEVALRAVMKCILDGRQAAILVPTTVLAEQHYQTALQRFFGFPVTIRVLNRFKQGSQTTETLRDIASGTCDLVIGTHRLLSKDIKFKDLGLLVVDEEQRFGVTHKEHIKEMSRGIDVLTLSATPIPRTLNMAMSGIRDMSNIDEPPEDRLPVQTYVMEHDWGIIADAIRRELSRGGQVYYLHNRINDIEKTAKRLRDMLEDVNIAVAHGQMDKGTLSSVMEGVSEGSVQVLVCTTIIETGIDIPNVNTLIIEDADRLGLAQLHQIRGRVGRSSRKASAYLTFRRDKVLTEDAEKRLNAIRDFAEFGSGLKIAMRDLEIRGAGNLLGAEQSGHMIDVGYDMYMKLLSDAVLEARGIDVPKRAECSADLAVSANIPDSYIPTPEQRMDLYRRIAIIRTEEEAEDILDEMIDRYGDPPQSVFSLVQVSLLRGEAGRNGITDISQKQGRLRFEIKDFVPERVFELYNRPEYKNRLKVEAGKTPCISLKINNKAKVIEEARVLIEDWSSISPTCQKQ